MEKHLWEISETGFEPARQNHFEAVCTIGNGYLGTRGVMEEGFPGEERSTFLHGVFDDVPVFFTELANIPDWMEIVILLAGERFSLASGTVLSFERSLSLRTATLVRVVRWRSPKGRTTTLRFERFASLDDPHLAGLRVNVIPEDYDGVLEVHSGINGETDTLGLKHWQGVAQGMMRRQAWLHCQTRASNIELAMGISLSIQAASRSVYFRWDVPNHPILMVRSAMTKGKSASIQKWTVIYTSRDLKNPVRQVIKGLRGLPKLAWEQAWLPHCAAWEREWNLSDVEIDGDEEAQLAVRFNIFQLLAAAPRQDERVSIGAKTLSGYGYRGHSFWDTEIFMLPFFTYNRPEIARNLLSYRWHNLPGARQKAQANKYQGAQFPWESAATGEEVTPTWVPHPTDRTQNIRIWTGDSEIHISSDVAYAIDQYWTATGDVDFLVQRGAEVILETARFWASRLEWDSTREQYEINDIVGPDEYHDHVDNNAFTNAMAKWHLQTASALALWIQEIHPREWKKLSARIDFSRRELTHWEQIIPKIYFPYDPNTRLIEQFEGYFQRKDVNLAALEPRTESIQSFFGIEGANETQALKQPDVLMLLYLLPDLYDEATLRANYAYYTPRTDHTYGSSLGPSIQAIMACRIGDLEAAYEHFMRAARADLFDVRGNADHGIHGASAGGLWQAVVFGFGGLHCTETGWMTKLNLPHTWKRLAFKIMDHGKLLHFEIKKPE